MACSHHLLSLSELLKKPPSCEFQCYLLYFLWMLGRLSTLIFFMLKIQRQGWCPAPSCAALLDQYPCRSCTLTSPTKPLYLISPWTGSAISSGKRLAFWLRLCRQCNAKELNRNVPVIFLLILGMRWRTYQERTSCQQRRALCIPSFSSLSRLFLLLCTTCSSRRHVFPRWSWDTAWQETWVHLGTGWTFC